MEIDESDPSGSEFQLDEESAQEEIMLDAAVRMSLQTAAQSNGAGPSSGRVTGSNSVAVQCAAAVERRLATGMRAMADAEDDEDLSELSDISSEEVQVPSKGKGKAKKVAPKGRMGPLSWAAWQAANVTMSFADWKAKQKNLVKELLAARRANKAEERAMINKLGRRLTHVSRFFIGFITSLQRLNRPNGRLWRCKEITLNLRLFGVTWKRTNPLSSHEKLCSRPISS